MSKFALDKVAEAFPQAIEERYVDRGGGEWAVVKAQALREVASHLKNSPELDFKLFVTLDVVDRLSLEKPTPRFEVAVILFSLSRNERVHLKVRVSEESPELPSLTPIFQGANWWERLAWDFYGLRFTDHPDLRRVLLYEEFQGHPLRKDYPLRGRQPLIPERPLEDIFRGPGTGGRA